MLRIAFAGTPDFAVPALRALAASAHRLLAVLSQPDRPAGRGRELRASPVKQFAEQLMLPVLQPARLQGPEDFAALQHLALDLLVVVAYGLKLPKSLLELPRLGCLNIHASLLPRWRGAAPIERAILAGDRESGVTIMRMDEGLDTGAILADRRVPIGERTDAGTLAAALAVVGAELLLETLAAVESGGAHAEPQPLEGVSYAAKIDKREARIDWRVSAVDIARQVRAFNPRPVAETLWQEQRLRIWEAHAQPHATGRPQAASAPEPGEVLGLIGDALQIACGTGVLAVTRLQLAGRRTLAAAEFVSGQSLRGARLT